MFSVYCTVVAAEVLLDTSHIQALLGTGGDLAMEYRCPCGERGLWKSGRGLPFGLVRARAS
ncbi:MAG: hypothetical protein ABR540_07530 [Acidimicrobiales bacterium]